ncbi:protein virilizer homolog [Telopea speciosissima]|uniref:protein virilizer homolog n=1 Tax=Telopea speciosissima TaxID=54955 RepID=UPI001CC45CC1|nr:protein virilizer homolog [Telopea speciosissima]
MGRPEPCVLFAHTFVHPQLDEYVDEVIFAEPVVISACEFLEQNASSASQVITLIGATSPPSFALEIFVQCEGEARFRRLCLPFLYSHSSSNVLEVEAVVTNHLVVRGSFRSLTLVIYGNTAEDLGQFIEVDFDSSLANLVSSPSEGKLEDLPPVIHSTKLAFEESISSLKSLCLPIAEPDISVEIRQFVTLVLKVFELSDLGDASEKIADIVVSAVSSYVSNDLHGTKITLNQYKQVCSRNCQEKSQCVLTEARSELLQLFKLLQHGSGNLLAEILGDEIIFESEGDLATPDLLTEVLEKYFCVKKRSAVTALPLLSQGKKMIVVLSIVLLLCSGRESCFHFVNGGGMEQLEHVFHLEIQKSTAFTLLVLGVVERATRHAIGCEGFLGWWPREDENVPAGNSEGYNHILKLLLQKQRHDVASLATYILHRLRSYEVASRYESAVLSVLGGLTTTGRVTNVILSMLISARSQLKSLTKLLNSRGPIEDPSPMACARRSLILGQIDGLLSYKATIDLIASSRCCFSCWDVDPHLLSLLKERGFLPLSAALLSSAILRSEKGHAMDIFVDIASSIEAILLSLLFCHSGLVFLLLQPEVTATVILSLVGVEDMNKEDCIPLRYASVLISKGFYCRPQEVGMICEMHLRVVNAIDRLLTSTLHSEEFLWVLWELCSLSRFDCGRQALLSLGQFPEAISVLLEALRSVKELEPVTLTSGASSLNLVIFHSIAELFEVIVTDSTSSSLASWIEHGLELHKVLHSSSPGSNRKDAPTRLLEWIDAAVVYQKNGAVGLLRYAAVLASGGDAHLTSTSVLVSDSMDVENVVGDSASGSDVHVVENLLGKLVADRHFDGVALRDSSVTQLTTAFRILAFIAENSAVAAALYEEGAVTLTYVVLVNCKFMLERSANTYDYLVDEGAECNSTSDLLLERNREQTLVDLLIPSLVLLMTLLQKLQEAKEQHRNKKLLNALLQLHREVSSKLAACATDLSCPYPGSAFGLGAVCHLIASALACWPVFGWTPGLFHCLLESVQVTSSLALGPKEACSLLCLLSDLFPEEGIWLWKNGIPSLSAVRTLAIGTLLGPEKERQVGWYLQPEHLETLHSRLMPLLDKIAQIILHFAFTTLVVIQDMLRVLIIRIACQRAESAAILLRPIISWIHDHISESSPFSDMDIFKVYRLLDFLASLLEHPQAKSLLLKEGVVRILIKALETCFDTLGSDGKLFSEGRSSTSSGGATLHSWCLPVFKSFALIFDSRPTLHRSGVYDKDSLERLITEECSLILLQVLKFCQVLPVGRELVACLTTFKELASFCEGRSAFMSSSAQLRATFENLEPMRNEGDANDTLLDESGSIRHPPLLYCCRNLLRSIDGRDGLFPYAIDAARELFSGALFLCMEGKNFNMERVAVLKCLFGLRHDFDGTDDFPQKKSKDLEALIILLNTRFNEDERLVASNLKTTLLQTVEYAKSILSLLQKPIGSFKVDDICSGECFPPSTTDVVVHSKILSPHLLFPSLTMKSVLSDEVGSSLPRMRKSDSNAEKVEDCFSGGFADKFLWECPDSSSDRLPALPVKRKIASIEGSNRRSRVEGSGSEVIGPNAFLRGLGLPAASSGPTRRDTFRQRKPNTSRPPSMHVDDYVARERNADGISSTSNVVGSIQRGGSTSGRPPSIHVDEFMARQRERQNPAIIAVGEPAAPNKNAPPENEIDSEKFNRSQQLKADLDDDLQEINIVFDDEETELDDRLSFPQPDDNLQPAPVITEENSPHSIVEETESTVNENIQFSHQGTPPTSNVDENTRSEFSSARSVSRSEMRLSWETSVSSVRYMGPNGEKPFFQEQSDETKNTVPVMPSGGFNSAATANMSGFPTPFYNKGSPSVQLLGDSRAPPHTFYQRDSPQQPLNTTSATGSQSSYEQKPLLNQPPLPPLPLPPIVSIPSLTAEPLQSHSSPFGHSMRDLLPPLSTGYPLQAFDGSGLNAVPTFHDSKYLWASASSSSRLPEEIITSSGSSRQPPLPPTPPPYSTTSITQSSLKSSSQPSGFSQTGAGTTQLPLTSAIPLSDTRSSNFSASGGLMTSYSPPPPPLPPLLANRPASVPGNFFSSMPTQQQGQNLSSLPHNVTSQPSILLAQPRVQLQPLQPPQPSRPLHPPQHIRPPQVSQQQSDHGVSLLQSPIQVQLQPLQMPQPHISTVPVYYQPQLPEHLSQPQQQEVEHVQPQNLYQQGDNSSQQHHDSGMSLQQFFSSPEAIQSLLSDREKLCQLLEQHPKLMEMLQDRLGQQ